MEKEKAIITLTINENFEDFDLARRNELIQKIKIQLNIDNDIKIVNIKKGSVIVKLKLNDKNAKKLLKLLTTGTLEGFDIEKAELLNYEKEKFIIIKNQNLQSLSIWKKEIKENIAKNDFNKVFADLKVKISPNEPTYDETITLEARYNETLAMKRNGTQDIMNVNLEFNKIRSSMLSMVNNIKF